MKHSAMTPADLAALFALAGLWGASYLFMRMGAGEFGAVTLAGARAALAALVLLPLLAHQGGLAALRAAWRPIALVGLSNCALPFVLFSYAALTLNAGLSAIFTATTPLFAAMIAALWRTERLDASRIAGLVVGFAGVLWLVRDKADFQPGTNGPATGWAVLACLAATLLYGFSANYSRQRLREVPPLAVTTGSQLAAAVTLAVPALWRMPATLPSARAWVALLLLALASTALAYVLFFRLIARVGASRTVSVTYLIPGFGLLWGALFLGEHFTADMAAGCAVILLGTALTTGVLRLPGRAVAA